MKRIQNLMSGMIIFSILIYFSGCFFQEEESEVHSELWSIHGFRIHGRILCCRMVPRFECDLQPFLPKLGLLISILQSYSY